MVGEEEEEEEEGRERRRPAASKAETSILYMPLGFGWAGGWVGWVPRWGGFVFFLQGGLAHNEEGWGGKAAAPPTGTFRVCLSLPSTRRPVPHLSWENGWEGAGLWLEHGEEEREENKKKGMWGEVVCVW